MHQQNENAVSSVMEGSATCLSEVNSTAEIARTDDSTILFPGRIHATARLSSARKSGSNVWTLWCFRLISGLERFGTKRERIDTNGG